MIRKLTNKEKRNLILGSGTVIGLYMIFILNNPRGWVVLLVAGLFYLLMKKWQKK